MKNEHYQQMFGMALEGNGAMLKGYSLFHNYSFANQMWAMFQMIGRGIEISPIAPFKKWQALGRNVKKGEKAIELCMPFRFKDKETDKEKTVFTFQKKWFAMAQTEGEEVEFPAVEFDFDKALTALNIEKVHFDMVDGNCQGFAKPGRKIAINPLAEMPHKTFFHEMGHVLLGHCDNGSELIDDVTTKKSLKEVEAESVALCCMLALGIEGIEYPRGYIKAWLGSGEIPADSIKKIFKVADAILKAGKKSDEVIDKAE